MDDLLSEPVLRLIPQDTEAYADAFATSGYVELTAAFPLALRAQVAAHAARAVETGGRRRDITVAVTGDSRRRYRLAGRLAIENSGTCIQSVYRSPSLLTFLSQVTGDKAHRVPYAPEEYLVTRFEEPGDTHGWHWDDYAFALIWVTAAPEAACGGSLEFIREVAWNKTYPNVDAYVATRPIERRHPCSGSVYLLRADTMLHRVTPLLVAARREILCLSYASGYDLERNISHETLEQLYAGSASAQ